MWGGRPARVASRAGGDSGCSLTTMPTYLKWGLAAVAVLLVFSVFWIVLLGPAALILLKPR